MATTTGAIDPWVMSSLTPRVGYMGNTYYFISTQFAHLFTLANQKGVRVDFPSTVKNAVPTVGTTDTPVATPLKAME